MICNCKTNLIIARMGDLCICRRRDATAGSIPASTILSVATISILLALFA